MSAPKHAPRVPFAVLVVAMVVGGLALLLMLNTASAANELQRHQLAQADASVSVSVEELRNEVAASAAPGNLAGAAAQLGMVPANKPAFLVIDASGHVRVLGHPGAAVDAPLPAATTKKTKPKPKPTATKTTAKPGAGRTTAAGSARTSAKSAPRSSAKPTAKSTAKHSTTTARTSPASPKPTPTPTPTLTLPGR